MSESLQELEQQLETLNATIRSGVLMMVVDGITTQYQSITQMKKVATELENKIATCKGQVPAKPRYSTIDLSRGV